MLRRCLLLGLALILLVSVGGVISCGNVGICGTYVNQDNPSEYLELDEDGTFYLREYGTSFAGEWEVKDDELRLSWRGMVVTAQITGNKLFDNEGKVWVKK